MGIRQELLRFHVRCFFTYQRNDDMVYFDPDQGRYECKKLKWNIWDGSVQGVENASDSALKITNALISKAKRKPQVYRFCSEHYSVSEKKGKLFLKKDRNRTILLKTPSLMQKIFRIVLSIGMAVLYGLLYVNCSGFSVAANLLHWFSRTQIITILFAVQILGVLLVLVFRKFKCDFVFLLLICFVPLNLISLVSLVKANSVIRIIVILVFVGTIILGVFPRLFQMAKTKNRLLRKDLFQSASLKLGLSVLICVFIGYFAIHFFGASTFAYSSEKTTDINPQLITVYAESCIKLDKTRWKELDTQEKLNVLQAISDFECKYTLGCPPPSVVAGYTDNESIVGDYIEKNNQITISVEHLKNGSVENVLDTLLHETRHAYQHAVVSMLNRVESKLTEEDLSLADIKRAFQYRDEFENYESGAKDLLSYYLQSVEVDSRRWAEERIEIDYMDYFNPNK